MWILGGAQEEISGFEAQILTDSADQVCILAAVGVCAGPDLTIELRVAPPTHATGLCPSEVSRWGNRQAWRAARRTTRSRT